MREAATFTLGRSGDKRAVAAAAQGARRSPALGRRRSRASAWRRSTIRASAPPLIERAQRRERATTHVRAACAYAIGARRIAAGVPALLAALDDNRGEAQRARRVGARSARRAQGARAADPRVLRARRSAPPTSSCGRSVGIERRGLAPSPLAGSRRLSDARGQVQPPRPIATLPGHAAASARRRRSSSSITPTTSRRACARRSREHRDVVVSVLADLDGAPDQLALGALTPASGRREGRPPRSQTIARRRSSRRCRAQLASDDPKVRALAVSVLAKIDGGKLTARDAAIAKALADPADQVRASAMAVDRRRSPSAAAARPPELVAALAQDARQSGAWADRRVAALALGQLGAATRRRPALVKAAGGLVELRPRGRRHRARADRRLPGHSSLADQRLARDEAAQARARTTIAQAAEAATRTTRAAQQTLKSSDREAPVL